MKIKSLLLGSAAASMLAATGAQAADPIVYVEPEPMEYVRICDVYGAGFFYIPGTETCLKISGYARYQISGADRRSDYDASDFTVGEFGDEDFSYEVEAFPGGAAEATTVEAIRDLGTGHNLSFRTSAPASGAYFTIETEEGTLFVSATGRDREYQKQSSAAINFDARSETEMGMLRGYINVEAGARGLGLPQAGINTTDSNDFVAYFNRVIIQLGGLYMGYTDSVFSTTSNQLGTSIGNFGGFSTEDIFPYQYSQTQLIGYQFSANGFYGTVAVENDPGSENFMPDITGKVAFQQAWGGVYATVGYDESADGFGIRGGGQFNAGAALALRVDGYYQSNAAVMYGRGAEWALQGAARYAFSPKLSVNGGVEYLNNLVVGGTDAYFADAHAWTFQAGMTFTPVENFVIGAGVAHTRATYDNVPVLGDYSQASTTARIRFQRNF